jgi:hypothetical protein
MSLASSYSTSKSILLHLRIQHRNPLHLALVQSVETRSLLTESPFVTNAAALPQRFRESLVAGILRAELLESPPPPPYGRCRRGAAAATTTASPAAEPTPPPPLPLQTATRSGNGWRIVFASAPAHADSAIAAAAVAAFATPPQVNSAHSSGVAAETAPAAAVAVGLSAGQRRRPGVEGAIEVEFDALERHAMVRMKPHRGGRDGEEEARYEMSFAAQIVLLICRTPSYWRGQYTLGIILIVGLRRAETVSCTMSPVKCIL